MKTLTQHNTTHTTLTQHFKNVIKKQCYVPEVNYNKKMVVIIKLHLSLHLFKKKHNLRGQSVKKIVFFFQSEFPISQNTLDKLLRINEIINHT